MRDRHAILIIIGIASVLIFICNQDGLGLTHDSHYYLNQATKLDQIGTAAYLAQFGWRQQFLVVVLATFNWSCHIISFVNGLLFIGTIGLWSIASRKFIEDQSTWLLFCVLMVFNTPMLLGFSFLWTEPMLYFIMALGTYFYSRREQVPWIAWLVIAVLMLFARKAGLLIIAGAVLHYVIISKFTWSKKVIFISTSVFCGFILYGNFGFPNVIGERPSFDFLMDNMIYQAEVVGRWVSPVIPFYFGIILLFAGFVLFLNTKNEEARLSLAVFYTYIGIRLFFEREFAEEHERYLSVVYPFFWLIICRQLAHLKVFTNHSLWSNILIGCIILYQVLRAGNNIWLWSANGCITAY